MTTQLFILLPFFVGGVVIIGIVLAFPTRGQRHRKKSPKSANADDWLLINQTLTNHSTDQPSSGVAHSHSTHPDHSTSPSADVSGAGLGSGADMNSGPDVGGGTDFGSGGDFSGGGGDFGGGGSSSDF